MRKLNLIIFNIVPSRTTRQEKCKEIKNPNLGSMRGNCKAGSMWRAKGDTTSHPVYPRHLYLLLHPSQLQGGQGAPAPICNGHGFVERNSFPSAHLHTWYMETCHTTQA